MVVLGTKPEYFNAVWVKNEWSRYLALVKKSGGKKILIPAYKDMDPYDLPEEFSHLQAQDMSKLGFMQDLLRGIKKIVTAETPKQTVKETVIVSGNANVIPLLKRVFIFLEDGEWEKADEFCEQVLNLDPENAQAYLGKLMAELEVSRRANLADCEQPIDSNKNFQKAIRYGDSALSSELQGYNTTIIERNEKKRLTGLYESAVEAMKRAATEEHYKNAAADFKELSGFQNADELADQCLEKAEVCRKNELYNSARGQKNKGTIESYEIAIRIFGQISGWKDADEQVNICRSEIEKIKERQEAERVEKERQQKIKQIAAKKAAKKRKIVIAIVAILAVASVTAFFLLTKVVIPNSKYNAALDLYNEGKYEEAISSFEALNGYKDSKDQIIKCETAINDQAYNAALELYNTGEYEEAIEAFEAMDGYRDSKDQIIKCETAIKDLAYNEALELYNAGKYEEAIDAFKAMDGYRDSGSQISMCESAIKDPAYNAALELYSIGKYEEAARAFENMDGYKDCVDMIAKCAEGIKERDYQNALALVNSGKYYDAYNAFFNMTNYKDSAEQMDNTKALMLSNAQKGDTVVFGHYKTNHKLNEWIVLDKQGEKLLLISKNGIGGNEQYNDKDYGAYTTATWEDSSLRAWLNGGYITIAFSSDEQSKLINTKNKNPNNPIYGTSGGRDTVDKVFLLSIDEVNKYFPTANSKAIGMGWWLRSSGLNPSNYGIAAFVTSVGSIETLNVSMNLAVRPALWINLGS